MVASTSGRMPTQSLCPGQAFQSPARQLTAQQRQALSLAALAGPVPLSHLAANHQVSRKFCYQQVHKAKEALDQAFAPAKPDSKVLFHLPVTRAWIEQFALAQALVGHTSGRGIQELLSCLLDYHDLSLGSIHNLLMRAAGQAAGLNAAEDLSSIDVGAFDEIYQNDQPVLVGMDVQSTYCFLMEQEASCDATTWGVHLLELSERQHLSLRHSIADGGLALRGGMAQAWPKVPCHGDVFHPIHLFTQVVQHLKNHAARVAKAAYQRIEKLDSCPPGWSRKLDGRRGVAKKRLEAALAQEEQARQLHEDVQLLGQWLREDVLALAGGDLSERRELYDFIVAQLRERERLCPKQLRVLRTRLAGQQEQLLGFVGLLDQEFERLAHRHRVGGRIVREMARLQGVDPARIDHWPGREQLMRKLGGRYWELERDVRHVMAHATRASSLVENLNGRLRCYFFLRRQLGQPYLRLLRFFLNHRPLVRSSHPQRQGKTPAQLLHGKDHPHWLEMLGYKLFERN